MSDDRFEDFVRRAAQGYRRPPETPREAMWARIAAERAERKARPIGRVASGRWMSWGLAAAAVLALGIGIGLKIGRPGSTRPSGMVMAVAPVVPNGQIPTAFEIAAFDHLRHVETFLTVFEAEAQSRLSQQTPRVARDLLQNTRLLMDSPAGRNAQFAALLDDIEVVLAQIASYTGEDRSAVSLIERGIEQRGLLLKLRAAMPAAYGVARAQGVL